LFAFSGYSVVTAFSEAVSARVYSVRVQALGTTALSDAEAAFTTAAPPSSTTSMPNGT
jgi:hypothetical protein